MYRVAVLFAPASLAELVAGGFAKRKFEFTTTAMSAADVSCINGAALIVLGAGAVTRALRAGLDTSEATVAISDCHVHNAEKFSEVRL